MRRAGALGAAIALLVAGAWPAPAGAQGTGQRLTLAEAIAMALRSNDGLAIEREALGIANGQLTGARGAYDPLLELDGGWVSSTEPVNSTFSGGAPDAIGPQTRRGEAGVALRQLLPSGGTVELRARAARDATDAGYALLSPAYGSSVGVELRQPLLRDLASDAARRDLRVARWSRAGAEASLRSTASETVAAVERAYWELVAARRAVEVREQAVRLAEEQLAETGIRIESGSAPRTELSQPRAELERRRGELLATREALVRSESAIKLLILAGAADPLWNVSLAPVEDAAADTQAVDLEAAVARALERREELAIAGAAVERRRAEAAHARSGVWPRLDAVVSYDRYGLAGARNPAGAAGAIPASLEGDLGDSFETLGDGDFDAARVALVLGLPIRNRAARGAATAARHAERQALANLERVRKRIRAEVNDAAAALETAGQRVESARAGREAAEIQFAAERDRFATGLTTNFLVLTRQNDLSRARLDEIEALADFRRARTEMARATGTLLETRGVDVGNPDERRFQ